MDKENIVKSLETVQFHFFFQFITFFRFSVENLFSLCSIEILFIKGQTIDFNLLFIKFKFIIDYIFFFVDILEHNSLKKKSPVNKKKTERLF